ncbi:hypothetical protein CLCR_04441 [Cladophialophora carrionii]|uniref:Uncharacterized protein n=1 Tax=Cladophialophora carrionii TaxID=86049 RepID=A0A1C1CIS6_9EURO|nr:hypothetical protein CLCR_04441 [Cladophialophora carrionii]
MARLVLRGKLFESFAGYHYKAYWGVALGYGRYGMIRHKIESWIIIDCEALNRFLPESAPPKVAPESDDKAEAVDHYKEAMGNSVDDLDYLGIPAEETRDPRPSAAHLTTKNSS